MLATESWERFQREAERLGLPLVAALPLSRDGALFAAEPPPAGATHAVIVMQAGGAFWEGLRALRARDPGLDAHPDPLDTYTLRMAARLGGLLGPAALAMRHPSTSRLDFVALGAAAGLGRPSRLAMLVHPTFGPWIAFRMLFFVAAPAGVLAPAAPLTAAACTACPAPCIAACPAGAIRGAPGGERLEYPVSFRHRQANPGVCADACAARLACPVGAAFRYPADALAHSHHRAWRAGLALVAPPAPAPAAKQGTLF
jgi:ferredoxin